MMTPSVIQHEQRAFSRNIGIISREEQARLRQIRVGIPGLGGCGGAYVQALTRLGVGSFHLADLDTFEIVNLNRQLGATMKTVGQPKTAVMAATVHAIDPDAQVKTFPVGINETNVAEFLDGVDIVVDGVDFFQIRVRRMLMKCCQERRIPVVTAAPIGFGASVIVFLPGGYNFDDHFSINDEMTTAEQLIAFALGMGTGLSNSVDPSCVNVEQQYGPSLASACFLCAALTTTEVVKVVTGRGKPAAAPVGRYVDPFVGDSTPLAPVPHLRDTPEGRHLKEAFLQRFPGLQSLHRAELGTHQGKGAKYDDRFDTKSTRPPVRQQVESMLQYVVRAPSGDNTQPWKFTYSEFPSVLSMQIDESRVDQPKPLWRFVARMSCGAALENLLLAAPCFGLAAELGAPATQEVARILIHEHPHGKITGDILDLIERRRTNRRAYDGRSLSTDVVQELESATPQLDNVETTWITDRSLIDRLAPVICSIDETMYGLYPMWKPIGDRIRFDRPANEAVSVGMSLGSLELTMLQQFLLRWIRKLPHELLRRSGLVHYFSKRGQNLIISSSGLFLVLADDTLPTTDVTVGRAVQQCWLALTRAGLSAHPMNSVALMEFICKHGDEHLRKLVARTSINKLLLQFDRLLPNVRGRRKAFLMRFGYPSYPPTAVSGRLPVEHVASFE